MNEAYKEISRYILSQSYMMKLKPTRAFIDDILSYSYVKSAEANLPFELNSVSKIIDEKLQDVLVKSKSSRQQKLDDCRSRYLFQSGLSKTGPSSNRIELITEKRCPGCKEVLPMMCFGKFYRKKAETYQYQVYCSVCLRKKKKERDDKKRGFSYTDDDPYKKKRNKETEGMTKRELNNYYFKKYYHENKSKVLKYNKDRAKAIKDGTWAPNKKNTIKLPGFE